MKYISTRNINNTADSKSAVVQGLASDGGLFVPASIPKLCMDWTEMSKLSYRDLCIKVIGALLDDFDEDTVRYCVENGYGGKFDCEELVEVKSACGEYFLELYHGPTLAFKDMALCLLPRFLTAASEDLGNTDEIMILTATSGDTGKAALEAFADVPGTSITVFYPKQGVSDIQKLQMQTQKGDNVKVCAIEGNFDHAQSGVKKAFTSVSVPGVSFGSANSINIGRLVPQVAYYFYAYGKLVKDGKLGVGEKLDFSVPTGNFGDILAGWIAKQMGLPVGRLLCASNKNNVLTDFIRTGTYSRNREFYVTDSPSMDILVSSNLERLLFYACGCDDKKTASLMEKLSSDGEYTADEEVMDFIHKDFDAEWADDSEVSDAVRDVWKKDHYLMDTHTAVAYACAKKVYGSRPCVILSTASPYKFAPAVLRALGESEGCDCFESMEKLERITGVKCPGRLAGLRGMTVLHEDCADPSDICSYVEHTASDRMKKKV